MKKTVFLLSSLLWVFVIQAQPITGGGVIYSTEKKTIPQKELDQMQATIERYFFLLNQYAERVVKNGDFSQTEDELVGLFNTYGDDRDTRVYNHIPLVKTRTPSLFYTKSIAQALSDYWSAINDSKRYITDNINHVLHSIDNLIYVDKYKAIEIYGGPVDMKYSSLYIPKGAYGLPEQTLVLVQMLTYGLDPSDEVHNIMTSLVFCFRNGKIESIVPPEQTMAFSHAVRLYQNKDYFTAYTLLIRLAQIDNIFVNAKGPEGLMYSLLSGCWKSHQIRSVFPNKVQDMIGEQYAECVKYLEFEDAVVRGNPKHITSLSDSTLRYLTAFQLYGQASPFSHGLMPVYDQRTKKAGFINALGEYAVSPQYLSAGRFTKGLAAVCDASTGKAGLINKNGEYIVKPEYLLLTMLPSCKSTYVASKDLKKYGCLDLSGNICVPLIYDEQITFLFDKRYSGCCRNGKWGVVSIDGKEVVPCQFEHPIWGVVEKDGILYYVVNFQQYSLKL